MKLFLFGVLQVFLVATNTRQVSQGRILGSFIVGTLISLVWAYNVSHVALGGFSAALTYALGAGCGTVLGILFTKAIYHR